MLCKLYNICFCLKADGPHIPIFQCALWEKKIVPEYCLLQMRPQKHNVWLIHQASKPT